VGSIEHEPTTMPHLSIWVHTTWEAVGDFSSNHIE
jgi:hypothetical protein